MCRVVDLPALSSCLFPTHTPQFGWRAALDCLIPSPFFSTWTHLALTYDRDGNQDHRRFSTFGGIPKMSRCEQSAWRTVERISRGCEGLVNSKLRGLTQLRAHSSKNLQWQGLLPLVSYYLPRVLLLTCDPSLHQLSDRLGHGELPPCG